MSGIYFCLQLCNHNFDTPANTLIPPPPLPYWSRISLFCIERNESLAEKHAGSEPGAYLSTKPPLGLFQGRKTIFSNTSAAVNFRDSRSGKRPQSPAVISGCRAMDAKSGSSRQTTVNPAAAVCFSPSHWRETTLPLGSRLFLPSWKNKFHAF